MTVKYDLIDHENFGHCAVSNCDIKAGEIVIEETPALVINYDIAEAKLGLDHKGRRAFVSLSECAKVSYTIARASVAIRTKLLQKLYIPDLKSAHVKGSIAYKAAKHGVRELRARTNVLIGLEGFSDLQLLKFSLLASANAHSISETSIALLYAGAKVSHTCMNPNVAVTSRMARGSDSENAVKHIAMRDIKAGELLLGTYAKVNTLPRDQRQDHLLQHKMFLCACEVCIGPDLLRGVQCSSCAGGMYCHSDSMWRCQNGDHVAMDEDGTITDFMLKEETLRSTLNEDINDQGDLRDIHNEIQASFLPNHWLVLAAHLALLDSLSDAFESEERFELDHQLLGSDQSTDLNRALELIRKLLDAIQTWFSRHAMIEADEMTPTYLLLVDRLLGLVPGSPDATSLLTLSKDILGRCATVIEPRRAWAIGHALEEYYDDLQQKYTKM